MKTIPPEVRLKMSIAHRGKVFSDEHRKNLSIASTGFKHSEATKNKMSQQRRGRPSPRLGCKLSPETIAKVAASRKGYRPSAETKEKIRQTHIRLNSVARLRTGKPLWNKGKKGLSSHTEATRARISETMRKRGLKPPLINGDKHYKWKGGVTPINFKIRNSLEYKLWRRSVFERDDFTCASCEARGVPLHAHHIKPFSTHPELRFSKDNGITLCIPCHRDVDIFAARLFKNHAPDSESAVAQATTP